MYAMLRQNLDTHKLYGSVHIYAIRMSFEPHLICITCEPDRLSMEPVHILYVYAGQLRCKLMKGSCAFLSLVQVRFKCLMST